eukprot:15049379-Alexandrium_andersonii.AAC.1
MSASLVGSEMCIRDRSNPDHRTAAEDFMQFLTPQSYLQLAMMADAAAESCLLYTSDAADDM